ncbi:hypothetical protein BJF83_14125 [Nocardiopsis sp. CNR-923]|uniref:hypothetical protein n=1 Tax=Nocardiopsis sp. CNR-923 TaxID=1904965 RepID=UPI00095DA54B|nr:hypothetical protein [Nocardiopsis sp. CNR-923]OLT28769.1 hypothetical protein BJF83_14125 [Nocardiopsis sp. CNR-923]
MTPQPQADRSPLPRRHRTRTDLTPAARTRLADHDGDPRPDEDRTRDLARAVRVLIDRRPEVARTSGEPFPISGAVASLAQVHRLALSIGATREPPTSAA